MVAVDTNILAYAYIASSPFHETSTKLVQDLANGDQPWGIPWPCIHEFLSIVTHPRVYASPMPAAVRFLEELFLSPSLMLFAEGNDYWKHLALLIAKGGVAGPKVHDARIAAICLSHGVTKFLSADRDFTAFPTLLIENPLARPS
jgi:toxin-antitoxin system PIN domain toxin